MLGMALSWTSWRHGMKQVFKLRNLSSQSLTLPCSYLTFASDLIDCSIFNDFLLEVWLPAEGLPVPQESQVRAKPRQTIPHLARVSGQGLAVMVVRSHHHHHHQAHHQAHHQQRPKQRWHQGQGHQGQSFLGVVRPQASVVVMVPRVCLTFLMKPPIKSCLLIDLFAVQCSTWLLQVD